MATYDQQWIIRYVDGELSPEELEPFETALRSDPALATEVALYRETKAVLQERLPEDAVRDALAERAKQLNRQYFGSGERGQSNPSDQPRELHEPADAPIIPIRKHTSIRWLARAAAAACIITAVALLWPHENGKPGEIGKIEMVSTTERGGQTDTLMQKAAGFFNRQQFEKALPILDEAVSADSSSMLALFYRGIAAWHTGDLTLARTSLEKVYNSGAVLSSDAAFYIALTYATGKNNQMAREWLSKISPADFDRLKVNELKEKVK